jgi:hypothetical protein
LPTCSVVEPTQKESELYPIRHAASDFRVFSPLWVDAAAAPVHFWDPMLNRFAPTGISALESAAMPLAGSMTFTTIIMMTTRKRGAFG